MNSRLWTVCTSLPLLALGMMAPAVAYEADAIYRPCLILANRLAYRVCDPQRGDTIIFQAPPVADGEHILPSEKREFVLIKRLIGLPGDTVQMKRIGHLKTADGNPAYAVCRNGIELVEPYIEEPMESPQGNALHGVNVPLKLGPGQVFVMGDNRNDSNDSRYWGTLERSRVIGCATFIVLPGGSQARSRGGAYR